MSALVGFVPVKLKGIIHIKRAVKLNDARRPEAVMVLNAHNSAVVFPAVKKAVAVISVNSVVPGNINVVPSAAFKYIGVCLTYVVAFVNLE